MQRWFSWLVGGLVFAALAGWQAAHAAPGQTPDLAPTVLPAVSQAGLELALQVIRSADHGGRPFAIVDKQAALLLVYRADGMLAGISTVLLGLSPGDGSPEGVGERARTGRLRIDDRTTPAGRFAAQPGHNLTGEPVVWIDYDSALAIHRLRPGPLRERRPQRLASASVRDKRISAGCVVAPEAFYDSVVSPLLGHGPSVVYVMPEERPWQVMWRDLERPGL